MFKKLSSFLAVLPAFLFSALAIDPNTASMYEKAAGVEIVQLSSENLTYVYYIVAVLCIGIIAFYIWDRKKRKRAKAMAEQERQNLDK